MRQKIKICMYLLRNQQEAYGFIASFREHTYVCEKIGVDY